MLGLLHAHCIATLWMQSYWRPLLQESGAYVTVAQRATINGVEVVYEVTGSGPPLVYVHGNFGGLENYGAQLPPWWVDGLYASHFTVVTYNRRGCGRSGMPDDGYTMATFAEDLCALMQYLGLEQASVLGTSAGGPIALRFALDYPQMVTRLVLVNTAADLLVGDQGAPLRALIAQARAWGADRTVAQFPAAALAAPLPSGERERLFQIGMQIIAAYEELDLTPELGQLRIPTLIVHGTADPRVPIAGAHRMHTAIPAAELRLLPGEGHGLTLRPDSPAPALVLEWLRAQSASHNPSTVV